MLLTDLTLRSAAGRAPHHGDHVVGVALAAGAAHDPAGQGDGGEHDGRHGQGDGGRCDQARHLLIGVYPIRPAICS